MDRGPPRCPRAARAPGASASRLPLELGGGLRHSPSQQRCTCNRVPNRGAHPPKVTMATPVPSGVSRSCDRHNPSATCKAPCSLAPAARCSLRRAPEAPRVGSPAAREPVSALQDAAIAVSAPVGSAGKVETQLELEAAAGVAGALAVLWCLDHAAAARGPYRSPPPAPLAADELGRGALATFAVLHGQTFRQKKACSALEPASDGFPLLPGSSPGRAGYCAGCVCGVPGCHRFEAFRRSSSRGRS